MSGRYGSNQDFKGNRLQNVGTPQASGDGVNKAFIRYDYIMGCVGKPLAGEIFPYFVVPVTCSTSINLGASYARCITYATGNATWTLYRIPYNSSTATSIATCTFGANNFFGSFTASNAITYAAYDMLYWVGPTTQDSTLSDLGITVVFNR